MRAFGQVDPGSWSQVQNLLRDAIRGCESVEDAAQTTARLLHDTFQQTTVLARVYATVPHGELPPPLATFAEGVAAPRKPGDLAHDTPVLTLLGTAGARPEWRDRTKSRGHQALPLLDAAFVESVPMLARLLRELGIDLRWLDESPDTHSRRLLGGFNGTFHVDDARTARDNLGRHIIPAQDFVAEHQVRTVFGMGGFYLDGTLIVCILFTSETISRAAAERMSSLISLFKAETSRLVRQRKLFRV
jgi:hypothetical protein